MHGMSDVGEYIYIYIRSDMRCMGLSSLRALAHVFAPLSASTLDLRKLFFWP